MNTFKRIFSLKRLFALVMTIAMIFTLSIPALTNAAGDVIKLHPLSGFYYTATDNLPNIFEGWIRGLGSNLRIKNNSAYVQLVGRCGDIIDSMPLPSENINFEQVSENSTIIRASYELRKWFSSTRAKFDLYSQKSDELIKVNIYVLLESTQGEIINTLRIGRIIVDTNDDWGKDRDSDIDFGPDDLRPRKISPLKYNVDPPLNGESGINSIGEFAANASVRSRTDRHANNALVAPNSDIDSFFAVNSDEVVLGKKRARN